MVFALQLWKMIFDRIFDTVSFYLQQIAQANELQPQNKMNVLKKSFIKSTFFIFLYFLLLQILNEILNHMIITKKNPPFKVKLLSIIPYIIQGMFCGFVSSIPLSYTTIPSYYIFSLFAIDAMPFSFKFLTAPIVQRWSLDSYGKRKTWIVCMIVLCSLLLYVIAEISYTQTEEYQKYVAVVLFFSILFTTLKDVATDSFVVEVFESSTVSVLQFAGAEFGKVATSPLFLYVVTSKTFNYSMSTIRKTYIQIVGTLGLLVAVILHFFFDQNKFMKDYSLHHQLTSTQSQQDKIKSSFSKIFAHYKKFIDPSYRLFRFAILLLLINQGSEIFMDAFPVQLIKMGIPRDTLMFGQNMCFVPNLLISFVFCSLVDSHNCYKYYYLSTLVKYFFMVFIYCLDLKDQTYAVPWYMVLYFVGSVQYFLQNVCITQESKGQFSGLSITLLLSISNLSRLTVLQKVAMDIFGYDRCVLLGFIYCLVMMLVVLRCYGWLQRGISLKLIHLKQE